MNVNIFMVGPSTTRSIPETGTFDGHKDIEDYNIDGGSNDEEDGDNDDMIIGISKKKD